MQLRREELYIAYKKNQMSTDRESGRGSMLRREEACVNKYYIIAFCIILK
jgi:hypothetical protein